MKLFNNKVLLQEIKPVPREGEIFYEDKDEVKLGKVAFDYESNEKDTVHVNGNETEVSRVILKAGDEVYYQYATHVKIDGVEYELVSESNLICQK